ncbi:hypothetical protein SAMN02983003_2467 [Devosia enhydra]|uniref:Uncharacterized protein n=1 Tax=Devosia enhydra TaxID=665118 RepID=A0A1K2HZF3_9HYPH|nr:hypothetical protein [Devosia enhydra]SFZ85246.1 hypothetical protein SAMN02983003_2467 [Devosia enhydra]
MKTPMALALAALLAGAVPALALDCGFDHAIYGQDDSSSELWFEPVDPAMGDGQANAFTLRLADFRRPLVGAVVWPDEEAERPVASLTLDCPAEAAPDASCPIWQGTLYAVFADGGVLLAPDARDPAPPTLILADLGPAIRAGNGRFGYETDEPVWDVFTLKACGT